MNVHSWRCKIKIQCYSLTLLWLFVSQSALCESAPPPLIKCTDGEIQATEFQRLFEKIGRRGLPDLMKNTDTNLALQASWEWHKKLTKRDKLGPGGQDLWTYDRGELNQFLDSFTERTKAPIPKWWSDVLLNLVVEKGVFHITLPTDKEVGINKIKMREKEWRVREGVSLRPNGESMLIKSSSIEFEYPKEAVDFRANRLMEVTDGKTTCIAAYHDNAADSFKICGFGAKGGGPIWISEAWALARAAVPVVAGRHRSELVIKGDTLFVFGTEFGGMYAEAFDLATGKCRFRFCTAYWENYSEKWVIR